MASSKLSLFLVLLHVLLFLSSPVYGNDEEDNLFQGINSFRESLSRLNDLRKNDKANCLADEISDELEGKPCSTAGDYPIKTGNGPSFPNYEQLLNKCNIDNETTTDGIILPACFPKLDPDEVLKNYTHTLFGRYLNDSKYTGVGVGSESDWVVVVLSTDSHSGSFSGAADLVAFGMVHYFLVLLLGLCFILL